MPTPHETTTEVVNVLDCLSALSADLNCKCAIPGEELVAVVDPGEGGLRGH